MLRSSDAITVDDMHCKDILNKLSDFTNLIVFSTQEQQQQQAWLLSHTATAAAPLLKVELRAISGVR
jgi:hypothetical protein